MKVEWRANGCTDIAGRSLVMLSIRTETEIILTQNTLQSIARTVDRLAETRDIDSDTFHEYKLLIQKLQSIFNRIAEVPEDIRMNYSTPWQSLPDQFHFAVMEAIRNDLSSLQYARIEGAPPNTVLSLHFSTRVKKIPVNDATLPRIKQGLDTLQAEFTQSGKPQPTVGAVGAIIDAVLLAIEAWRLYREEQDRREQQRRQEEEDARRRKDEKCIEYERVGDISAGGPALDDIMDRISSLA